MVFELPFELDTVEAFQTAPAGKLALSIVIRIAPFVLYVICAICEYIAVITIDEGMELSCMKYYGVTDHAVSFLYLSYIPVVPDAFFALVGPISVFMLYNNPYGVVYNFLAGMLCFVCASHIHAKMSICGYADQDEVIIAPFLQYLSGVLHLFNSALNHITFMYLDKEGELYFGNLQDLWNDLSGR